MITQDQLNHWFVYHSPTIETQKKYAAIRAAEDACHDVFASMAVTGYAAPLADCDRVNASTRAFAEAIDANAPDSADKAAAIRCVRLARNAANEHIMACALGFPTHINNLAEAGRQLV